MNETIQVRTGQDGVLVLERAPALAYITPELLGAAHPVNGLTTTITIEASNGSVQYEVCGWDRTRECFQVRRTGSTGEIPT